MKQRPNINGTSNVIDFSQLFKELYDSYKIISGNKSTMDVLDEICKQLGKNFDFSSFTEENINTLMDIEKQARMYAAEQSLDVVTSMDMTAAGFDFSKDNWDKDFVLKFKDIKLYFTADINYKTRFYSTYDVMVMIDRPYGSIRYELQKKFHYSSFYYDIYATYTSIRDNLVSKVTKGMADRMLRKLAKDTGLVCELKVICQDMWYSRSTYKALEIHAYDTNGGFIRSYDIVSIKKTVLGIGEEYRIYKEGEKNE